MSTKKKFNINSRRKMKKVYFNIGHKGKPEDMAALLNGRTSYLDDHYFLGGIQKAFDEGRPENLRALLTASLKKQEGPRTARHTNEDPIGRQQLMVQEFLDNRTAEELKKLLAIVPEQDRQALLQQQLGNADNVKDTQALLDAGADIHANNEQALVITAGSIDTYKWLAEEGPSLGSEKHKLGAQRAAKASLLQAQAKLRFLVEKGADFDKAITAAPNAYAVDDLKQARQELQAATPAVRKNAPKAGL